MLSAMDVAAAVSGLKDGKMSAAAFRRLLVSWNNWAASKHGDVLALRSDADIGTSGVEAFAIIGDVRIVTINAGTIDAVEIVPDEFAAWREIASAVNVERAWQRLAAGSETPDDLMHVARFSPYHIAAIQKPESHLLIHVPHDDGGMFVPIFTHRDGLEIALAEIMQNFPSDTIVCTKTAGPRLFPPLANEKASGIVINYLGPSEPIAFRMDVLPLIIDALEEPA
jgi:hypothetical protein